MFLTKVERTCFDTYGIKPQVQSVYNWLRDFCYYDKRECYPSKETLADKCKCSVRSIDRHLNTLYSSGLIIKTRRGKMLSNIYTLPLKTVGEIAKKIEKQVLTTNSKYGSNVTGQSDLGNKTTYINDDYAPVQDIINEFIKLYDLDIVNKALERLKGKTISIKGFYTYFKKTIDTIIKHNSIKKKVFNKKPVKKSSNFNNFEQRIYDYNSLENKLLGYDNSEYSENLVIGSFKQESAPASYFNHHTQRGYDFKDLEKKLLGWE